jgi:phage-related protein
LPAPVQGLIVQVGALVGAFALVAAPLGFIITGIGSLVSAVGSLAGVLGSLSILSTIAGWLGALAPVVGVIVGALKGLGAVLLGVFSGPVGWVALAVAAGAAIYAFRDQIGQAFQTIAGIIQQASAAFKSTFIDPVIRWNQFLIQSFQQAFNALPDIIRAPFQAAANIVRGVVNGMISGVGRAINGAVSAINSLIAGANRALARLKLPTIPMLPSVNLPQFADGGVVTKPTLAMVGEGGEPEYIVPQSKAAAFAQNWIGGARGSAAIPSGTAPTVSIQTGPVTQMDGTNYVTTQDLGRAVEAGVQQTLALLRNDTNTRRALGIA